MFKRRILILIFAILSTCFYSCDNTHIFDFTYDNSLGPRFLNFSLDNVKGSINVKQATVMVYLPATSNLSSLVPEFTIFGDHVEHNDTLYESGSSAINFSSGSVAMNVYLNNEVYREFTIEAANLAGIDILPDPATVGVSQNLQLTALAQYSNGATVDVTDSASWASSNTNIATITTQGMATGVALGQVDITCTYGSYTAVRTVDVNPVLTDITISLAGSPVTSVNLELGEIDNFEATANYIGQPSTDVTASANWTIESGTSVTVAGGTVQAIAQGTSVVEAEYGGVVGSVTVNAVPRNVYYVAVGGDDTTGYGSLASPYASISKAMSMASAGNEIRIGGGNYIDSVNIKEDVSIYGGWDMTNDIHDPVNFPTTLTGNDLTYGYAIIGNGSPTAITSSTIIDSIHILGASIADSSCFAVLLQNDADPIIANCEIVAANNSSAGSCGIYIYSSSPVISQCTIDGGSGYSSSAGIIGAVSSPIIEKNYIDGGSSAFAATAIHFESNPVPATIRNNLITGGSAPNTAAIELITNSGSTEIFNNTIDIGSGSSDNIYGISIEASSPNIVNNILYCSGSALLKTYGIYEFTASGCTPSAFRYNWIFISGNSYVIQGTPVAIDYYGTAYPYENNHDDYDPMFDGNYCPTNFDAARSDGAADLEAEGMGFNDDYYGDPRPTGAWAIGAVEYE